MTGVLDDYLVDPRVSLLDKTRMQAQVLVPVLRTLRAELGREQADAVVKRALRAWSKQLFAAIADGIEGSPRRKRAALQKVFGEVSGREVDFVIRRHDEVALDIDVTSCRFAEFFRPLGELHLPLPIRAAVRAVFQGMYPAMKALLASEFGNTTNGVLARPIRHMRPYTARKNWQKRNWRY